MVKAVNREDFVKDLLEPDIAAFIAFRIRLQELQVRQTLKVQQVRHMINFFYLGEIFSVFHYSSLTLLITLNHSEQYAELRNIRFRVVLRSFQLYCCPGGL